MAKKILQVYRDVNFPFFGRKRVNVPLTLGVGLAALGTIPLLINQIAPKYTVNQRSSQQTGQTFTEGGQTYIKKPDGTKETVQSKQAVIVQRVNPTVPLYSIVKDYIAVEKPYRHLAANQTDWESLADLIEAPIKASSFYNLHGAGNYIANQAGEILPRQGPINQTKIQQYINISPSFADIKALADFIMQGGVWIDYTKYPLLYADGQAWFFGISNGVESRFNEFCNLIDIPELGHTKFSVFSFSNLKSDFFAKPVVPNFPYDRSLTLLSSKPSTTKFKTSDMISNLQNVPYSINRVYSMFALKYGNGIYFYSNTNNSPQDYATFIIAVHNNVI